MPAIAQLLALVTIAVGLIEMIWVARYAYEDFGGLIGVVGAFAAFPLTLAVAPFYGMLARGDWLGFGLLAIGVVSVALSALASREPHL